MKTTVHLIVFLLSLSCLPGIKTHAQNVYGAGGLNILANDRVYFNTLTVNPCIGIAYTGKNPALSYEITSNFIAKEFVAIPVLARINSLKTLSISMGTGFCFSSFDNNFDVGFGISPGVSYNLKKIKINFTGSIFPDL